MSGTELTSSPLYDATCMLQVDAQMGHGFVIILGGMSAIAPANNKKNQQSRGKNKIDDDNAVMLGYLAITEGNVVDACFGIKSQADRSKKSSVEQAKRVKSLITNAADSSDSVRRLAVETYRKAFVHVLDFHKEVAKLNFFTKCFSYGKIQHEAEMALKDDFAQLKEAVAAAM
jgi:hypothetical protein